jgi:hypothetical protein
VTEETFHIEFDGSQLTITTDVDSISEFVRRTYGYMLVERALSPVGSIDVRRTANGFALRSLEPLDLSGESSAPLMPYLKEEVIMRFMRARPDLLWIHAGAVERNEKALLISGASGQGKSTLTTMLVHNGWRLMSDDVAPIRMNADQILPFYQAPLRRIDPGKQLSSEEVASLERESVALSSESLRADPAELRAVVFPMFDRRASTRLIRMAKGAGALELLRNARNMIDHKAAAVERAAQLARSLPMFQLCYGSAADAVMALNDVL